MAKEISLDDALQQFIRQSRMRSGLQSLRIEEIWAEMMGKTIARYTKKIQLVQNTLFISTDAPPLRTELLYQKNKIRQQINEALGEDIVREVVVQ